MNWLTALGQLQSADGRDDGKRFSVTELARNLPQERIAAAIGERESKWLVGFEASGEWLPGEGLHARAKAAGIELVGEIPKAGGVAFAASHEGKRLRIASDEICGNLVAGWIRGPVSASLTFPARAGDVMRAFQKADAPLIAVPDIENALPHVDMIRMDEDAEVGVLV